MPYIERKERKLISPEPGKIDATHIDNPGKLNYAITELMDTYLFKKGKHYQTFNDLIGALENAKMELYRRQIADYEQEKMKTNGDVYSEE